MDRETERKLTWISVDCADTPQSFKETLGHITATLINMLVLTDRARQ